MKLLRAQFGEHSVHLPGMLSKGGNNKVLATRGEGDDPNTSVFRGLDPGYQALREETAADYPPKVAPAFTDVSGVIECSGRITSKQEGTELLLVCRQHTRNP